MASYRRSKSPVILTGIDEVDERLKEMQTAAANRAARAGLAAGGRAFVKDAKAKIPSTMKDAKKVIGFRIKKAKRGPSKGYTEAKAGAAVGKKKQLSMPDRAGRKGVGIGTRNIHWFILGTKERHIKKGGKNGWPPVGWSTGRMLRNGAAPLQGIISQTWAGGKSRYQSIIKDVTLRAIKREWDKSAAKYG